MKRVQTASWASSLLLGMWDTELAGDGGLSKLRQPSRSDAYEATTCSRRCLYDVNFSLLHSVMFKSEVLNRF